MADIQQVTRYYYAAYTIAGLVYAGDVVSLIVRSRLAMAKLEAAKRWS